jgi:hypothetical protein
MSLSRPLQITQFDQECQTSDFASELMDELDGCCDSSSGSKQIVHYQHLGARQEKHLCMNLKAVLSVFQIILHRKHFSREAFFGLRISVKPKPIS